MFIPRIDSDGKFDHKTLFYIPDTWVDELWKNITEPYKLFFERNFKSVANTMYRIPLTKLEDTTDLPEYCEKANHTISKPDLVWNIYEDIPYVDKPNRVKYNICTKENESIIKYNLNKYLIKVFAQRVDLTFDHNLYLH